MKRMAALLAVLALFGVATAQASDAGNLNPTNEQVAAPSRDDQWLAHYVNFNDGYAWQGPSVCEPYYGAFAEGFEIDGPKHITGVRLCVASIPGLYSGEPADIYVWEGGVTGAPGAVVAFSFGNPMQSVPIWPDWAENDFDLMVPNLDGEYTAGFWVDSHEGHEFFILADESGPAGHPWTNFAPNSGYGPGWDAPNLVESWSGCKSLGIAVRVVDSGVAAKMTTWGAIKALFE